MAHLQPVGRHAFDLPRGVEQPPATTAEADRTSPERLWNALVRSDWVTGAGNRVMVSREELEDLFEAGRQYGLEQAQGCC